MRLNGQGADDGTATLAWPSGFGSKCSQFFGCRS